MILSKEMAYTGAAPWKGLGNEMPEGATTEQWLKAAGMDWEPEVFPVEYTDRAGVRHEVKEQKVVRRSDTGDALGVVGARHKMVSPRQVMKFFERTADDNGFELETAGTLFGGRRYWAFARTPMEFTLPGKDRVVNRLMLATSCDGSMSTVAKFFSNRLYCLNQLEPAFRTSHIRIRHSSEFDETGVKIELASISKNWELFGKQMAELAKVRVNMQVAVPMLVRSIGDNELFGTHLREFGGDTVRALDAQPKSKQMIRILELFQGEALGAQSAAAKGTAWGLLNAATQYYDHEAGRSQDNRLYHAWFGAANKSKNALAGLLVKEFAA